ncbi:MAG: hypothetical protein R6V44_02735 [Paracoccaceae bacterium]
MPYANLQDFMVRVRRANPNYEHVVRSSLHGLVGYLSSPGFAPAGVPSRVVAVPAGKRRKYREAMHRLIVDVTPLSYSVVFGAEGPQRRAVRFAHVAQAQWPDVFARTYDTVEALGQSGDAYAQAVVAGAPPALATADSVEQFMIENAGTTGVVMIHLNDTQAGYARAIDGQRTIEHVISVLRVAEMLDMPVMNLAQNQALPPVAPELVPVWNDLRNKRTVVQPHGHMGDGDPAFNLWAERLQNVVVTGYDAEVCVHANIFGAPEHSRSDDRRGIRRLRPLTTVANVISSRAIVVSTGAVIAKPEFGLMNG